VTAGLAVGAGLFSSLTVQVDEEELRFYFGTGYGSGVFPSTSSEASGVVRNPVYNGWGIRYTIHGWLYNVSGLKAIELDIGSEGLIRIGTDEPEQLRQALEQARQAV
jgi:hypothetical protein